MDEIKRWLPLATVAHPFSHSAKIQILNAAKLKSTAGLNCFITLWTEAIALLFLSLYQHKYIYSIHHIHTISYDEKKINEIFYFGQVNFNFNHNFQQNIISKVINY